MTELAAKLERACKAPILLVACDFDGTLAPIVDEPSRVQADKSALQILDRLSSLRQTFVSVISGRAHSDLRIRAAWADGIRLVGSHGLELSESFASRIPHEALAVRERIVSGLREVSERHPRLVLEEKPAGVAIHYRQVPREIAEPILRELRESVGRQEGVFVREGLMVLEFSVLPGNKGLALNAVRHETGGSSVIFLGDDVTDEDAFASLGEQDVSIKVGWGGTCATFRIGDVSEVVGTLQEVLRLRESWLSQQSFVPIEAHSLLSDQRTVALVNPEGRVVWMCLPRIDSGALFSELLGGASHGYFDIRPVEPEGPPRQQYVEDTLVLITRWSRFSVVDYLDCSEGRPFQRAGRTDLVRVLEGEGRAVVRFAPRLNFGRTTTRLYVRDDGVGVQGTPDPIVLHSPGIRWTLLEEGPHQVALAEIELRPNQPVVLDLRYGTGNLRSLRVTENVRRRQTESHWGAWLKTLKIPAVRPDLVRQSALMLRGLCYRPSGAIAAAGTAGLPEFPGGVRNWDYRFCWPRDAALAARALVRLGSTGQALRFLDWLMGVLERSDSAQALRPIYTVSGSHLGPEAEVAELSGYLSSRPVRVGNAAADQVQLDVFGPITDLIASLAQCEAPITPEHWRLTEEMVSAVEHRWQEPDHGIWELRSLPKHHVYSKVMCWQTVDRAQQISMHYLGEGRPAWDELRFAIAQDVLSRGFNQRLGTFTTGYEDDGIDAAGLHVGLSGLLAADDPRFLGTVRAVENELRRGPVVYRYRFDDGIPGREGGFQLCTAWLIEAYLMVGRVHEAQELFNSLAATAGPTGLLAEEWDPKWQMSLGNVPQAYSHLGLINTAILLDQALQNQGAVVSNQQAEHVK